MVEFKNPPVILDFSNPSPQSFGCFLDHATCHTPWKLNLDISKSGADLQHQGNWDSLTSKINSSSFKVIDTIELESLFL